MKKFMLFLLTFFSFLTIFGQNKMAYQVFEKNGKMSSYNKVLKAAAKTEVVLFGEFHDNSVIHWLQLEFSKDLSQKWNLVLGAEMMEADIQKPLNQYLNNEISQK